MRRRMLCCLLVGLSWASLAAAQSPPSDWSWEFVASHIPKFEEKQKENKRLLVVEVLFRNTQTAEQKLVMAEEAFQATDQKGKAVEILGLLFRMQKLEGAKRMSYTGGMKRMETLSEMEGESSTIFLHSPGPVEVAVEGGQTYKQRLLMMKPQGKKPFRLRFNNLPALEIQLPK